jgi:ribosomal 50S subunit-recycling heat shock protein
MRLDKFLKVSRIVKRRTIANEACDNGLVMVNGKTVKAGYNVKVGDILEVRLGPKSVRVEVTELKENAGKAEAAAMYREIS